MQQSWREATDSSFLVDRRNTGEIKVVNTNGMDFKEKTAVGYCRVSTRKQKDDGMSLDTQKDVINKFCKDNNIILVKMYSEAGHGHEDINKRKELEKAFNKITKHKVALFIVCKQDRLARDNGLLDKFSKKYFIGKNPVHRLLCLDDIQSDINNPEGEFTMGIKSNFSVLERKKIGIRTKMGLDRMKRLGLKVGGMVPHGYKVEIKNENGKETKYLVPDQEQIKLWEEMRELHEDEEWGWTAIARELTKRGIKNKRGIVKWSASQVMRVFHPQKKGE